MDGGETSCFYLLTWWARRRLKKGCTAGMRAEKITLDVLGQTSVLSRSQNIFVNIFNLLTLKRTIPG